MKILQELKVEALAFEVPEGMNCFEIAYPIANCNDIELCVGFKGAKVLKRHCVLPEGDYEILGRANELKALHGIVDDYGTTYRDYMNTNNVYMSSSHSWQSYMEANNLTNELILIKQ